MSRAIDSLGNWQVDGKNVSHLLVTAGSDSPLKWIAESNFFRSALSLKGSGNKLHNLTELTQHINGNAKIGILNLHGRQCRVIESMLASEESKDQGPSSSFTQVYSHLMPLGLSLLLPKRKGVAEMSSNVLLNTNI